MDSKVLHQTCTGPAKFRRTRKQDSCSNSNCQNDNNAAGLPARRCPALTRAGNPCPIWPPESAGSKASAAKWTNLP